MNALCLLMVKWSLQVFPHASEASSDNAGDPDEPSELRLVFTPEFL